MAVVLLPNSQVKILPELWSLCWRTAGEFTAGSVAAALSVFKQIPHSNQPLQYIAMSHIMRIPEQYQVD